MRHAGRWLAAGLLGLAWPSAGQQTILHPDLSVDHTALVLKLPDGKVLRGADLEGAVLQVNYDGGQRVTFRIDSVKPDPADPDILRHELSLKAGDGRWQPACEPNFHGETWGIPIALPPGHPGREGPVTLTCASGAVLKCVRFGYKPWGRGPHGEDLAPYHEACMHMVRADYCGDGQAHTRNGTQIGMYDPLGIQVDDSSHDPGFTFEAGWAPSGAACVARTRWEEELTLEQLHRACPQLPVGPQCDETFAAAHGALIFNRRRVQQRLGE